MSLNIVLCLFENRDLTHLLTSVLYNRDQSPGEVLPGHASKRQIKGGFWMSSKIKSLHFVFKYRKVNGFFLEIAVPSAQLEVSLAVPRTLLWSGLVILPGSLHMRSCSSDLFPGLGRTFLFDGSHRQGLALPFCCESCWCNMAVVSSLQRYPVTELDKSQTREGPFQETEAVVLHLSLQVSRLVTKCWGKMLPAC